MTDTPLYLSKLVGFLLLIDFEYFLEMAAKSRKENFLVLYAEYFSLIYYMLLDESGEKKI